MAYIPREVIEMKSNMFSQELTARLITVSARVGRVRGRVSSTLYKDIVWEIMLISEVRYLNVLRGQDYTWEEIVTGIFSREKSKIKDQYALLVKSISEINKISDKFGVVPATDLIRVHNMLFHGQIGTFEDKQVAGSIEVASEELWKLLTPLYDPENPFPKLVEAILLWYCVDKGALNMKIHPFCKELILNYGLNNGYNINYNSIFIGKQLVEQDLRNKKLEDYITDSITVLSTAAVDKGLALLKIEDILSSMERKISSLSTKLPYKELSAILKTRVVLNNTVVENDIKVSAKTAISYLKKLEDFQILRAVRVGREKLYINESVFSIMKQYL